jgi:hypothetical protein
MNIKAVIASLVLGSSSVAMAAPSASFKPTVATKYGATTVRDHRNDGRNEGRNEGRNDGRNDGTRTSVARPVYRPAPVVIKPVIRRAPVAVIHQPVYRGGWFTAGWNGWSQPVYQQPVYEQPVYQPVVYQQPAYQQPVTLASGLSFYGEDRKFINVGAQAGLFGKLEINAAEGQSFIKQVYVQFDDGQEQVIRDLDRTLTPGQCLTLDLDGDQRAIRRIVVYGTAINNGWQGQAGAFNVTAA